MSCPQSTTTKSNIVRSIFSVRSTHSAETWIPREIGIPERQHLDAGAVLGKHVAEERVVEARKIEVEVAQAADRRDVEERRDIAASQVQVQDRHRRSVAAKGRRETCGQRGRAYARLASDQRDHLAAALGIDRGLLDVAFAKPLESLLHLVRP